MSFHFTNPYLFPMEQASVTQHASLPSKIIMIGLDGAGKLTMMNSFGQEVVCEIPAIGYCKQKVVEPLSNLEIISWDVGADKSKPLWKFFFESAKAIIWVMDSKDPYNREWEAKQELDWFLEQETLQNCPLLVFCNKSNVEGAKSPETIAEALHLKRLDSSRPWKVLPSVATSQEGIRDGLEWLQEVMQDPKSFIPALMNERQNVKSARK